MRRIVEIKFAGFIFLIALVFLVGCRKDPIQTSNSCDSEIWVNSEEHFLNDAIELTLRQTRADSLSPFHTNPEIDQQLVQHILGKLSVIYNESSDTSTVYYDIVHRYKVHYHGTYAFNSLVLKFADSTLENEFVANAGNTSSTFLNSVFYDYGFELEFEVFGFYFLYSENNYNIVALCDLLETIPGIESATPNAFCCDGNDIEYSWTTNYDEFIFSYGIGDCPSGCFGHHFWKIRVDNNCKATFIEEYGDPLPG